MAGRRRAGVGLRRLMRGSAGGAQSSARDWARPRHGCQNLLDVSLQNSPRTARVAGQLGRRTLDDRDYDLVPGNSFPMQSGQLTVAGQKVALRGSLVFSSWKSGGRGRNRTFNLSIKSRMLCQLSYASGTNALRHECLRESAVRTALDYFSTREPLRLGRGGGREFIGLSFGHSPAKSTRALCGMMPR